MARAFPSLVTLSLSMVTFNVQKRLRRLATRSILTVYRPWLIELHPCAYLTELLDKSTSFASSFGPSLLARRKIILLSYLVGYIFGLLSYRKYLENSKNLTFRKSLLYFLVSFDFRIIFYFCSFVAEFSNELEIFDQ